MEKSIKNIGAKLKHHPITPPAEVPRRPLTSHKSPPVSTPTIPIDPLYTMVTAPTMPTNQLYTIVTTPCKPAFFMAKIITAIIATTLALITSTIFKSSMLFMFVLKATATSVRYVYTMTFESLARRLTKTQRPRGKAARRAAGGGACVEGFDRVAVEVCALRMLGIWDILGFQTGNFLIVCFIAALHGVICSIVVEVINKADRTKMGPERRWMTCGPRYGTTLFSPTRIRVAHRGVDCGVLPPRSNIERLCKRTAIPPLQKCNQAQLNPK